MSAKISPKSSLPYGWVAKASNKYPDRKYYFNFCTGVSTWERPELSPFRTKSDDSKLPTKLTKAGHKRSSDSAFKTEDEKRESQEKKICFRIAKKANNLNQSRKNLSGIFNMPDTRNSTVCNSTNNRTGQNSIKNSITRNSFDSSAGRNSANSLSSIYSTSSLSSPNSTTKLIPTNSPRKSIAVSTTSEIQVVAKKKSRKSRKKKKVKQPNNQAIKEIKFVEKQPSQITSKTLSPLKKVQSYKTIERNSASNKITNLVDKKNKTAVSTDNGFKFPTLPLQSSPDFSEDIEMLDVSLDLTKIDDLPVNKSKSYYIVLDTNIFISELNRIDEIKDTDINNCGPPYIFIPWIVIQELDNLRQRSPEMSTVFRNATAGVKYVNRMIKAKHPRFHGQSPKEMKDCAQNFSSNNDDRVLECCLNLAEKIPQEKVILLTNDINLSNKALICDIRTYTFKSFIAYIKLDVKIQNKPKKAEIKKPQPALIEEDPQKKKSDMIMVKARQLLKDALYSFLEAEMSEAYGDCWKAFKIEVNLLKGILNAIERYWRTVFCFHFNSIQRLNFTLLQEVANRPEGFCCKENECLTVLTAIEDVFRWIKKQWPALDMPIENIQKLKAAYEKKGSEVEVCDDRVSEVQSKPFDDAVVLSVFEHDWIVLNHLCGMVMDFYGVPHDFFYEKPTVFPAKSEFDRLMCNLYPATQQLKELMSRIVDENSKTIPPGPKFYQKFHTALKNLVPNLKVEVPAIDTTNLNVEGLEHFCNSPVNLEKISFGFKQLEHFSFKLEEALNTMTTLKKNSNKMICE